MDKEFKLMLAAQQMPDLSSINYPIYIQPKYDGYRALYIPGKGFISRTGKKFRNKRLESYFEALNGISDYVLDGELFDDQSDFQNLASIINKEDGEIGQNKTLKYLVFDAIPLKDWESQNCKLEYNDRIKLLRSLLTETVCDYDKVLDVETRLVYNFKEAKDFYKLILDHDGEGIMIRKPSSLYKWGRSTIRGGELLKVKPFKSLDLEIIDVVPGEGQFEESMGCLACRLPSGGTVFVGSGFSVVSREEIWNNKENYIGKIAEVKYMEETAEGSLRQPIFIRMREDK